MTLKEYINGALGRDTTLTAAMAIELLAVIASRGKNKGRIKTSLPAQGKTGRLGWNAVMLTVCPQRAAVWSVMFEVRSDGTADLWEQLTEWCERNVYALQLLGTRPYQFSLWDHHYDRDRIDAIVHSYVMDGYKRGANWRRCLEQLKKRDAAETETETDDRQNVLPLSTTIPTERS